MKPSHCISLEMLMLPTNPAGTFLSFFFENFKFRKKMREMSSTFKLLWTWNCCQFRAEYWWTFRIFVLLLLSSGGWFTIPNGHLLPTAEWGGQGALWIFPDVFREVVETRLADGLRRNEFLYLVVVRSNRKGSAHLLLLLLLTHLLSFGDSYQFAFASSCTFFFIFRIIPLRNFG